MAVDRRDISEIFEEKEAFLEKTLSGVVLTPKQKELIRNAMEFGYAAATWEAKVTGNTISSTPAMLYVYEKYERIKKLIE